MSTEVAPGARGTPTWTGLPVFVHVLREGRRSLLLWTLAMATVAAVYTASYTAVGGAKASAIKNLPPRLVTALDLGAIATPGGYLSGTVYGILGPALLLVFAIGRGAHLLAGQEQDGTLELELTHPVSRRRVYTERLLGLWVAVLTLLVALTVTVLLVGTVIGMGLDWVDVLAGGSGLCLLVLALGTLAFAVGAATGRHAAALGAGSAVAVLAYAAHALGIATATRWLADPSPWSWYLGRHPLTTGFDGTGLLRLAAVALAAAVVGIAAFDRRDLGA